MKIASMKPEVALFDNEDLEDLGRANSDWQFISLGEQQNFGIKTAGIYPETSGNNNPNFSDMVQNQENLSYNMFSN